MPRQSNVKLDLKVTGIGGISRTWEPNESEMKAAWELYVEIRSECGGSLISILLNEELEIDRASDSFGAEARMDLGERFDRQTVALNPAAVIEIHGLDLR